jgi:type II secretory pathway pseudopilin PulG
MGRSRTNLTTKQVYLAPRAEAAAAAAAATATPSTATAETDAELGRLQGLQLQEQQQQQQQQQQQLASAADRQHLEACYGLQDSSANSSSLQEASTSSSTTTTKRYLCYFLHRLLDFRVPELAALADMYGVPDVRCEAPAGQNGAVCPFWYVHLPNDQVAAQIVARAVLTRVSCCCLDAFIIIIIIIIVHIQAILLMHECSDSLCACMCWLVVW